MDVDEHRGGTVRHLIDPDARPKGAGDGIMGAAQKGGGRENGFGLNIRLPFEQSANETIDGDHMKEIMEHGRILNPPNHPSPPDIPDEDTTAHPEKKRSTDEGGDFPGDLAPVGA